MKNLGLSNVAESMGSIPPGGYICKILDVEDVPQKEYLKIKVDIAQGQYKGHYKNLEEQFSFWGLTWFMSYKDSALGLFKAGISALRASNEGFQWADDEENDERKMIGCLVGGILGEEEYLGNDGSLKCNVKFKRAASVQDIIDGNYKVPEKKKLAAMDNTNEVVDTTIGSGFQPVDEDEMPF